MSSLIFLVDCDTFVDFLLRIDFHIVFREWNHFLALVIWQWSFTAMMV